MLLRPLLLRASQSAGLRRAVTSLDASRRVALRFIAGEELDDALRVTRELAARGARVTLDHVGEHVTREEHARAAAKAYLELLDRLGALDLDAGISVKPTQLGLEISPGLCEELLAEVAAAAGRAGAHVTLDMEEHAVTEATVRLVETMHERGHSHVGCALQAYLHRTLADVRRCSRLGASVRLCKGAYAEPAWVAFQSRRAVNANYRECAATLLDEGTYPRFATHDHRLIATIKVAAARRGRDRETFEFQMLYGVRPRLQEALLTDGYRLCVYVPFGRAWYPYFIRRLAERPANTLFLIRALARR